MKPANHFKGGKVKEMMQRLSSYLKGVRHSFVLCLVGWHTHTALPEQPRTYVYSFLNAGRSYEMFRKLYFPA